MLRAIQGTYNLPNRAPLKKILEDHLKLFGEIHSDADFLYTLDLWHAIDGYPNQTTMVFIYNK
ncbi:MAG: hypothetical protein Q6373_002360 [Candidatus Sigynarchaeota archaeon]